MFIHKIFSMRKISFWLSLLATVLLILVLSTTYVLPLPFGKFMNPFAGWWQNAERPKDFNDFAIDKSLLKEEATVIIDDRLIPHIFAKNNEDLLFLQGYITAKYRLWQMEIQTHNAAGRVSEIVGEKALDNDRLQRRIGLQYGAEKSLEFINQDAESKRLLTAYCNGVNAYINSLRPKDFPIEYKLLNYAPEQWTPLKVALLLKNMANMLSVYEFDIENSNFVNTYGAADFAYLFPEKSEFTDFIIPKGTPFDFKDNQAKIDYNQIPEKIVLHGDNDKPKAFNNCIPKPKELNGSNNWAVAGSKTKSGKPILCNDPHLTMNLPSIWYEIHLVSPTINVYGASLPGAPCVISGFNDAIAWGVTNGGRDVRDWYAIDFTNPKKEFYRIDDKAYPIQQRVESYRFPNGKTFSDTVSYTKYGPIVYDDAYNVNPPERYLALRWTAHEGSNEFKTFYLLNQAKNYQDYLQALTNFTCPTQNFVFACKDGDIAIKEQGKHPITNKFIADGSNSKNDWTAFIPTEHNPTVHNPPRGFVSSANQFPVDETYPYPVSRVGIYEELRAMRINHILSDTAKMDVATMKKLQQDNYNTYAAIMLPTILRSIDRTKLSADEQQLLTQLDKWDFYNNPESIAATVFEAWNEAIIQLLWDEMADPAKPMRAPNEYRTAFFIKNDSVSHFYDNLQTGEKEDRQMLLLITFSKTCEKLRQQYGTLSAIKDWGTNKATYIHHLSPALDAFSRYGVYNGGNLGIVNATNQTHGPSWRMIVDFGEMKGYCIIPGGQSGNPGSKYYDDEIDLWAKGDYHIAYSSSDKNEILKHKKIVITVK